MATEPGAAQPIGRVGIDKIIEQHSSLIAARLVEAGSSAGSEEEVRVEAAKVLDGFIAAAGLEIKGRHEYGLAGGRIDSKYGGVILEFKNPKSADRIDLSVSAKGTQKVTEQIKSRFLDFQRSERIDPHRLFGFGCDGKNMLAIRYRGDEFEVETPQPITPYTVERLLRALVSLGARGKSYTPENLTHDFGAESGIARTGIAKLFDSIAHTTNPKASAFFAQWQILFSEVCGYDVAKGNDKLFDLAEYYAVPTKQPAILIFALHTYYAIFMKFLAAEIVQSFSPLGVSVLRRCVMAPTSATLRKEMEALEHGGIWSQLGITNFLEGDLFSWYLAAWDEQIADAVRGIAGVFDGYDPTTLSVEPAESRDLLKILYQRLFPGALRHALGEYYTPDWLAEHLLDQLDYDGNPDTRILDPACGSGTFLVLAVNRIKTWFDKNRDQATYDEAVLVRKILSNVIGFDLNPLAVMAARTNFLLAIRDLLRHTNSVELPIYMCDAIMVPADYSSLLEGAGLGKLRQLKTSVGDLLIPSEVVQDREILGRYTEIIERSVRNDFTPDEFLQQCSKEGLDIAEDALHRSLFKKLAELDKKQQNGIWARIIRNSFAPLFVGHVDIVVGNPPWVNWESLPDDYRKSTAELWQRYDLFPHQGYRAKLGAGKDDLSILMSYVAHDRYLRAGGKIGFVITQSVFKTTGGGEGFRHFSYLSGEKRSYFKLTEVHDLSSIQPFEGATNRTATFVASKSHRPTTYPIPYVIWRKSERKRIGQNLTLSEVMQATTHEKFSAAPINSDDPFSPWLTVTARSLEGIQKVAGASAYQGAAGTTTWLNGVYWIEVIEHQKNGHLLIRNLHDVGKKHVKQVEAVIEDDLVFPLIRGRDISRWHVEASAHIIVPNENDRLAGIPESTMRTEHGKTYEFLKKFEKDLKRRSGLKLYFDKSAPFYSIYNVGPYTFEPWKVMWPEVGNTIVAGVSGPRDSNHSKGAVPDHTVIAVATDTEDEAHFICALLNSSPARLLVLGYIVLHPSPHVLANIRIPKFSPKIPIHQRLADLSKACHRNAADSRDTQTFEMKIDELAAELWAIRNSELVSIQRELAARTPSK